MIRLEYEHSRKRPKEKLAWLLRIDMPVNWDMTMCNPDEWIRYYGQDQPNSGGVC